MRGTAVVCRNVVTFAKSGELDDDAYRASLQRFIDAKVDVYIGALEGHALTRAELRQAHRVGAEFCKGKIQVNGNPPERQSAREFLETALDAVEAGVDIVNVYGPAGWHAYQPTDAELQGYFDTVLSAIRHPVALAPLPVLGYPTPPGLIVDLCRRYRQVVAINLAGLPSEAFMVRLLDGLDRDLAINVPWATSPTTLGLGGTGILTVEANIVPKTFRRYAELYDSGKHEELHKLYAELTRLVVYVQRWKQPRWIKMAMRMLKLPGGEGGLREPYVMPPQAELEKFTEGLLALEIPEITEMARAAGLR